ncbi:MAG TPA: hypothetical protein VMH02_11710 [Verrucomicrobiae bacterium]|nr:hypothetical protein [Verrucomicrobiae bacterium]
MRLVFVVVALFCAYLTGNRLAHPFIDGDLFWQRQLGEYVLAHHAIPHALGTDTFTAAGAPWVPHEWLLSTVVALAFAHDAIWTLSVLAGLAVFVALMLAAWRAKRAGTSTYSTLAVLIFAGICLEGPFAIRAQVLAWPLLAALMLALDLDGPGVLLALPLIAAWANLHASVMIAVPIVWLDAVVYAWQRWRDGTLASDRGLRWRAVLCVGAPLATLCTPLGIALPIYSYDVLNSPLRQYIAEWQPLNGLTTQIVAGFFPLLALCLWAAPKLLRRRPRDLFLTLLMAVWTFVAVRNIALFGLVAVTGAAFAIDEGKGWEDPLAARRFAWVPAFALLVLVPLVGAIAYRAQPISSVWTPPTQAVAALARMPGEHDLLCAEFSKCSVFLGTPNVRDFIDGRADPFPPDVWSAFVTISAMLPGWQETVDHYRVNAILANRGSDMESALKAWPAWREVPTSDACCTLFVRKEAESRPRI